MGARGETSAKQFEAKTQEATAAIERLTAGNAKHALEFANVSKADTLALHEKNAAAAAATLRSIADAEFDRSGAVLNGMPPMSAGQLAGGLLCGHVDEHLGSIRATVGH